LDFSSTCPKSLTVILFSIRFNFESNEDSLDGFDLAEFSPR